MENSAKSDPMNAPERFEMKAGYASFRPVAKTTLAEAIELVYRAILFSREQQIKRLFVDTTNLTGFGPPKIFERFFLGERLAAAAQGRLKLAMLARPEMIHPEHFGVLVARNRGLYADVFSSEAEALEWLLSPEMSEIKLTP